MRKRIKKLTLARETLRELTAPELSQVAGGQPDRNDVLLLHTFGGESHCYCIAPGGAHPGGMVLRGL